MQEGAELRRMLAAWEALRLGKDAQIAALLRHCMAVEPASDAALHDLSEITRQRT